MRKILCAAAAVFVSGALAIGCGSDSSDAIAGSPFFRPDNFPGGSVDQNNLADDGRAFSNAGQSQEGDLEVFWNCTNGSAIAMFTTEPGNGAQEALLYAAYFDGSAWHAPVELHGDSEDTDFEPAGYSVLWLNTTGATDPEAAGRNGDAIIIFKRRDAEPVFPAGSSIDEDGNVRLYGAYFDRSEATAAATGTVIGGFQTVATAIDDDNTVDVTDTDRTGDNDNDPDVSAFGFASDSLCCTHEFRVFTVPVDSGELTTFVHIFWTKDPVSGDPSATEPTEGDRLNAVQFDLGQVGNALPTASSADVIALPGGLDTADTEETVVDQLVVHNGHLFYNVDNIDDTFSTDRALIVSVFTTAAGSTEIDVGSAPQDDSDDFSNRPGPEHVYGADHGSASTVFFFSESGFEDDFNTGNRSPDFDLMVGELRVDAAGATTEGTSSPLEIDAHTDTLDVDDTPDGDGFGVVAGFNGDIATFETAMNRTGTLINVIILQEHDVITDSDDADAGEGENVVNRVPFSTVYQVRQDVLDARLLADSVPATGPLASGALEGDFEFTGTTGQTQDDTFDLQFQLGLADGEAKSQGGSCDRGCTFQGNNRRVSWTYVQTSDQGTTDDDNNILYLNGQTTVLGATSADPPVITLTGQDEVEELDVDYGINFNAEALDAGDATTTGNPPVSTAAAGRVLVFFNSNENNETENTNGSFNELRLYVSEQAGAGTAGPKTLVSTDPTGGFQADAFQVNGIVGRGIVPVNEDTVNTPNHVGTTIHLLWEEERNLPGSGRRLAARSYSQAATTSTNPVVALADRFTPPLPSTAQLVSTSPTFIDNPWPGDLNDSDTGVNNTTFGVYFFEDGHLYYQETSGTAAGYITENGVSAPQLVDNDQEFSSEVNDSVVFFPPVCNDLAHSQVVFSKDDGGANTDRLFIRSHN